MHMARTSFLLARLLPENSIIDLKTEEKIVIVELLKKTGQRIKPIGPTTDY